MAFNPDGKVADARALAAKYNKSRVLIIFIDDNSGSIEIASYGKTKKLCGEAKDMGKDIFEFLGIRE